MRFRYSIAHVPGIQLVVADALSRSPVAEPSPGDQSFNHECDAFIESVMTNLPSIEQCQKDIKLHQQADEVCQLIIKYCY